MSDPVAVTGRLDVVHFQFLLNGIRTGVRQLEWNWNALLLTEQLPRVDSVVRLRNVS
jgi:hypothetical protein